MKTARCVNEIVSNSARLSDPPEGPRTIFISHALANGHTGFLVGVLQDHDLGQLDTEPAIPS